MLHNEPAFGGIQGRQEGNHSDDHVELSSNEQSKKGLQQLEVFSPIER